MPHLYSLPPAPPAQESKLCITEAILCSSNLGRLAAEPQALSPVLGQVIKPEPEAGLPPAAQGGGTLQGWAGERPETRDTGFRFWP